MNITQLITARIAGNAMCELGEIWKNGMMPHRFIRKMKLNNVVR